MGGTGSAERIGDPAFDAAFDRLFARAYHVAFRILGHSGEAEDVAAEAMARALDCWRRVRDMASPDGWVVRVTTNLAIDLMRRRKLAGALRRPFDGAAADDQGRADARVDMGRLLGMLPRRQREVLALRYLADLSEAETAAVLGIAPGTVKRHANRGISKMRRELAGEVLDLAS